MDESTALLKRLTIGGFVGAPIPDACGGGYIALVYMRWWSSGVLDVVTVYGERDSCAYRAGGLDPRRPDDVEKAVVRWRTAGSVVDVTSALLELSAPDGLPILVRPANQHAVIRRTAGWTS